VLLKEWRWKNRISQKKLSSMLELSQSIVSRVEKGLPVSERIRARFTEVLGEEVYSITDIDPYELNKVSRTNLTKKDERIKKQQEKLDGKDKE